jgi:hypothetical protein
MIYPAIVLNRGVKFFFIMGYTYTKLENKLIHSPESPKSPPAWIQVLYENELPSPDTGPGGSATTVSQPRIQNTRDYSIRMIGWSIISGGALRSGLAVVSFLIACSTSTTRSVVPDGTRGDTWPRSRLTSLSSPPHLHLHLKARLPS